MKIYLKLYTVVFNRESGRLYSKAFLSKSEALDWAGLVCDDVDLTWDNDDIVLPETCLIYKSKKIVSRGTVE